ncbi:YeiH family protein [Rossellomorea aquimaris]|uniref:YeiH family protein n=1 Tax=Rossellomorea aquimaris TaxID=189382 RepID=UPI001CD1EB5E|nr:YeiH family protein [Rossellomorea aquimaris]MCA1053596.1 YeiH family protein [Rossellomorea aquimaris]
MNLHLVKKLPKEASGLFFIIIIGSIAKVLGAWFPLIGSILFAILIGILLRNVTNVPESWDAGITFTTKKLLKVAIVFLGVGLSLVEIMKIGQSALWIILVSVTLGITVTFFVGKLLGVHPRLSLLIGIGTSICGATAISAVKGIIGAKENETAYALSTIVFFNLIAFFLYPYIGHLLHLGEVPFGIWAGTAVHDTSSAVAVGYRYGDQAGEVATTVKLARTLFLIPVMILLPFMFQREASQKGTSLKQAIPWFVLMFLGVSLLHTMGLIPVVIEEFLQSSSKFMIIMVMAAVGLQVNVTDLTKLGFRPLLTGLIAFITCAVISLLLLI